MGWLKELFQPTDPQPEAKTEKELERQAVKQEIAEIQARLRALSAEADVIGRRG